MSGLGKLVEGVFREDANYQRYVSRGFRRGVIGALIVLIPGLLLAVAFS